MQDSISITFSAVRWRYIKYSIVPVATFSSGEDSKCCYKLTIDYSNVSCKKLTKPIPPPQKKNKKKTHKSLQSSTTKFGNNSAVVFRLILRHLPNFFLFFFLLWLLYYSKGSHGMSPSVAEYDETCFFFWPAFTLLIIQPTGQQSRNRKKNEWNTVSITAWFPQAQNKFPDYNLDRF